MCTENHVCFGRIHGSQLREGANAVHVYVLEDHMVPNGTGTMLLEYVHVYHGTVFQVVFEIVQNDLKYKHSGATGH